MASGTFPPFSGLPTPGPLLNYVAQVTSEYRGSPRYLAWLAVNLQPFQDGIVCMNQFDVAFGLLTAVGPQLDVLGNIVGQSRTVGFQPRFSISPTLDDNTYRLLLRARIWQNHWSGILPEIWAGWNALFPGSVLRIKDNQDMTVSIVVGLTPSSIIQDLITNGYIIPRPQGVMYTITIETGGWNTGEWNQFTWGNPNPAN